MSNRNSIFLSHNSNDGNLIANVASYLEGKDIPCWYAPRNIKSGEDYNTRIATDIEHVQAVLVFITKNIEKSEFVHKEISMAINYKKTIIPILIDGSPIPKNLELFLCNIQWINAQAFASEEEFLENLAVVLEELYGGTSAEIASLAVVKQPIVINHASTSLLFELTGPILLRAENVFVPVEGMDFLHAKLEEQRIIYIHHPQHIGKYTLALALLRNLGIHDLFEWSKEATFPSIIQHRIKKGAGFIIEISKSQDFFQGIHEHDLEQYIAKLHQRDSFLILIGREEPRQVMHPYSVNVSPPEDIEAILLKHIPLVERDIDLQEKMSGWIHSEAWKKSLLDVLLPRDAYSIIQKVRKLITGEITEKELVQSLDSHVRGRVKSWFKQPGEKPVTLKEIAFYLTLTVFGNHPYHVVINRSRELLTMFMKNFGKDLVFEEEMLGRDEYLSRFNAHVKRTWKHTDAGTEEVETVCFYFPEDVPIIWEYIWTQHPEYIKPLVQWIQELLSEGKQGLNESMKEIIVHLLKRDSGGVRNHIILPLANSVKPKERLFAARILEELAMDEERTHYVFTLANSWASQVNNNRLHWTAVAILGGRISVSYFPQTLRLLYKIHQSGDGKLDFSVQKSLATVSEIVTYGSEYEKLYFRFWISCFLDNNKISHEALRFAHSIFAKSPQVFFETDPEENEEFWINVIKTSLTNMITKRTCTGMLESWVTYASGNLPYASQFADLLFSVYKLETQSGQDYLVKFIDKGLKRNSMLYGPIHEKLVSR